MPVLKLTLLDLPKSFNIWLIYLLLDFRFPMRYVSIKTHFIWPISITQLVRGFDVDVWLTCCCKGLCLCVVKKLQLFDLLKSCNMYLA